MKKIKTYLFLHIAIMMVSVCGIFSKTAALKEFFSLEFIIFYGFSLSILAVYALLWQQIIKIIPLNVAYANKAVALVWGMIWGAVIFKESISLNNIIGAAIALGGVLLMVTGGEKKNE